MKALVDVSQANPPDSTATRSAAAGARLRDLMLEVFRLNGALLRHGAALTAPLGQTQARWQVIGAVAEATRTVPQIARRMGMTRQGVQRVTDLLVGEGIVTLVRNPDHARSPLLRLTPKGRQLEQKLGNGGARWSESMAAGMNARDLEKAVTVIRAVVRRLDEPSQG